MKRRRIPEEGCISGEASSTKITRRSADAREECRFVLLGGEKLLKAKACNIILRIGQRQQGANLEEWKVNEKCVLGRHVTVAVSPTFWLEHLKSYYFFSRGVKSINNDIKKCVPVVFPGPHAFLLVVSDRCEAEKAHYLLNAVASVFGDEALDYSMVLFIEGAGEMCLKPDLMKCVKMCERRHHFLKDTDNSVQELFMKVEDMLAKKKKKFFIPSAYAEFMEDEFNLWEKKRVSYINTLLDKKDQLIKEQKTKLDATQLKERELQMKLNISRSKECTLRKKLHTSQLKKNQLQKKLNASQQRESKLAKHVSDYELKNSELTKLLDDFTKEQEVQPTGTRRRRSSKEFESPNFSTDHR